MDDGVMEVQRALDELEGALGEALEHAQDLARHARKVGGEISRVVGGQTSMYTIGTLEQFIESLDQPGSVASMRRVLEDEED